MLGNDCTKFGALVHSVTILPNIYHKAPDYNDITISHDSSTVHSPVTDLSTININMKSSED